MRSSAEVERTAAGTEKPGISPSLRSIRALNGRHPGADIWVLAAGPSLNHVDPGFFDNKLTLGVNEIWRWTRTTYLVRKEAARAAPAAASGIPLIVSRYDCGNLRGGLNLRGDYVFDHAQNGLADVDLSVIGGDRIVVSYSTITSAMHLAAYMGAANIILCGHDCGLLDGEVRVQSYPDALGGERFYRGWLGEIEPQTLLVRARLQEVYGCRIYSLNPFVNFGLEGHRYERT